MTSPKVRLAPVRRGSALGDLRFAGGRLATHEPTTRTEFAEEITRAWGEAQDSFLRIGRLLIKAKNTLPHGEYQEMVERDMPFGASVGRKLRAVAEAADAGVVDLERLPPSYATIYEVATMSEEARAKAADAGILRRDVTIREVRDFKRSVTAPVHTDLPTPHIGPDRRREELERLLRQRDDIDNRIRELREQLGRG